MIESYNDFPVLIIKKPGEQQMKRLICLILMGVLTAQNSSFGESQLPKMTSPFEIDYLDLPYPDTSKYKGKVLVKFIVDERGKVINPEIIDTFDIEPLPKDHPLLSTPNTLITPHIGYVTNEAYEGIYATNKFKWDKNRLSGIFT